MRIYKGEERYDELRRRQTRQFARKIAKRRNHKIEKTNSGYWVLDKNQSKKPEYYENLYDYVINYLDTTKF